jgi:electron-transferring-flavoprotein dehydrogenase
MYHYDENRIAVGFIVGLGYRNPYLSPFEEFQRYKTHPAIRKTLASGRRIAYGARTLTAGGLQALPELTFPGGALIGDDAGFLNASRGKGSHTAMKSGMLAAEAIAEALAAGRQGDELETYGEKFRASWLFDELYTARNFRPLATKGLWLGSLSAGLDQQVFHGKAPWTLALSPDHLKLKKASECRSIAYPKPDGKLSFDRLSSVFLANTHHEENQPCHLQLKNPAAAINTNLALYDAPERRYCPAGVYEIVHDDTGQLSGQPRLQINAQNCLHCKACDIKDPTQNIVWAAPQGGEGPIYPSM